MHFACIGIGVGPANLSLACLLDSHRNTKNIFFEKSEEFNWHDGMQIPETFLQVSLFKDLVLLADPTNRFSFICYLHAQGRIYHFLNAEFERVSRQEFRDYMSWASKLNSNIQFGERVLSVDFQDMFIVETTKRRVTAENICVGVGIKPKVPGFAKRWSRQTQFHASEFVSKANDVEGQRIIVVGGGQSGAEAFLDLISRPTNRLPRQVVWISRRENFLPLDETPFTNDYFMPSFSELFYKLNKSKRTEFVLRNYLASDGISQATLKQIYQRVYSHHFVEGTRDLVLMMPNRTVIEMSGNEGTWELLVQHNGYSGTEILTGNVVIWATGYRRADMSFLKPIQNRFAKEDDEYRVDEDFAVHWDGPSNRCIFMQNASLKQRGLADPNLSLVAWRSQRIVDRLHGVRKSAQRSSFVAWGPMAPTAEQKLA